MKTIMQILIWGSEDMIEIEEQASEELALNTQEKRLIRMIRAIKFGELHIFVSDGKPIRVEEIKKSIKL